MSTATVAVNQIVEQIGEDFGVTVRYRVFGHYVDFKASPVLYLTEDQPHYEIKGAQSLPDDSTPDFDQSERWLEGSVKWDGCAHYWFGDDEAYIHLCGANDAQQLAEIITIVHRRCGELMVDSGQGLLDGEFQREQ
jgi:hypothetical protein